MVHKRKTVTDLEQRAIERKKKYVLYLVKEIMEDMNRSEASVSKHLSELEDTRLLERMQCTG